MKIDILSLFPEMFTGFINTSIIKRAREKQHVVIEIHDFRTFSLDKHHKVDDYPYGGGQGMVLMCQPLLDCLKSIRQEKSHVILLSPQGTTFCQQKAKDLTRKEHLILICGHYEGFDERIRQYVDEEISIGDYVLTGGELGSMVITDAVTRLLNGVIETKSHEDDSFSHGLLEYPQYTRPEVYDGKAVPEVLLSGHHAHIEAWRMKESLKRTYQRRPDLLEKMTLSSEQIQFLEQIKKENS